MMTLVIMAAGVVVGLWLFPPRLKKWNEAVQLGATLLLIFSMGVGLGSRPGFLEDLAAMGLASLVYALMPMALSVLAVYLATRRFMK